MDDDAQERQAWVAQMAERFQQALDLHTGRRLDGADVAGWLEAVLGLDEEPEGTHAIRTRLCPKHAKTAQNTLSVREADRHKAR